jgi:DNA end-binding protein Ku
MARPIWRGTLSFGLLHVPVSLMPGERRTDLSFRMLDSRDNSPVRYERVNAETGEEVPWDQIVKAYEYDKGSYVVLDEADIRAAASESKETVEVEAFVEISEIGPQYFEKPYVLVPDRKSEKGYVLLRETLAATGRAGIARVVIRTREYLSAVLPRGDALVLILLRFPQELVEADEYRLPSGGVSDYRIAKREMEMAAQLIDSMTVPWSADDYKDDYRERLHAVIEKRLRTKDGVVAADPDDEPRATREDATTNVVDFVTLLEKSIKDNRRTPPAKKKAGATSAGKTAKKATKAATKSPTKTAKKASAAKKAGSTKPTKAAAKKSAAKTARKSAA